MANRNYKDTLFRDLFGKEERKANALELYNALNGTDYRNPDDLELTTLEDVIYFGMKNDVSFVIGDQMVLWEHQSTKNNNMPLRGLLYYAKLFTKEIERRGLDVHVPSLIRLPRPEYVVFYIGETQAPDRYEMRLSDAFGGGGCMELVATVININEGHNPELAQACKTLAGYSHFVALVRRYNKDVALRQAIDRAVDECVAAGVLSEYLREKRGEIMDLLTEYDEDRVRRLLREDAIAEGRREGLEEGKREGAQELAALLRELGVPEETLQQAMAMKQMHAVY